MINSLDDDESFAIIEHMQTILIYIQHPNLVQYRAIKIESESPQIKFLILEEDLGDNAITLKTLYDTLKQPQNHLLSLYFSERMFLYQFLIQTLQGLTHLNLNGKTFGELHGDISPVSIAI